MIRARIYLLAAVVIWGWTFVATKVCLEHLRPFELFGLRLILGVPFLGAILLARGIRPRFAGQWKTVLLGSFILAAHFLIQITGLEYTSATNTGWIIAVTPLVLALLAAVWLREKVGRRTVVGIAVATFGILVLVSGGDLRSLDWLRSVGDWLVLASAHTWALYTIAIRALTRSHDPLAVTFAVLLPAAAVMLVIMGFRSDWSRFLQLPADAWVALLFLAIPGLALAHWFWQIGLARIGAADAGVFLYLEPLSTMALAIPYLGESVNVFTFVGGAFVLAGVWWSQRRGA